MKSFSKSIFRDDQNLLENWNPTLLGVEFAPSTTDTQKEQILALFRDELQDNTTKKETGDCSILHTGEAGLDFAAWLPDEMNSQPPEVRKVEWTFIESADDTYKGSPEPQSFEFAVLNESPLPSQPQQNRINLEKETAQILEQARLQAEELILAAQAEADNVLLQAEEEIEQQKKAGYQQSWDQACADIEDTLKATHLLVEEVRTWKTELTSQGEQILIVMLKEIAQKMFGDGVDLDTNALQVNLNHIMESAHGLGNLNIFLNPRDAKNLDPSWSEYQKLITGDNVKIIPSGKITRGGCFVKGEMGIVDGRVETQLSAILKTFDEPDELAE